MKLNAEDCARLAMDLADGPPIPYILGGESLSGMDCQGLIEYVVRRLGGKMAHAGSNDMYRNACAGVWPLKEAQRTGRLTPGAVLFIVKKGGEPEKYEEDGRENASHVGWYTGGRHEAVHASSAAGKVTITTLRGGWTHAGRLKAVEYEREGSMTDINAGQTMTVRSANGSSVRLRRYPGQQAGVLVNVPSGETVEACGEKINHKGLLWTPVRYDIYSGFMMSSFLKEGPPGGEDREIAAAEAFAALSARVAALEAWRKQAEGGLPV